jgi:hypothetical protein
LFGDETEEEGVGKDGGDTQDRKASEPSIECGAVDGVWTARARYLDEVLLDLHEVAHEGQGWGEREHDSEHGEVAELRREGKMVRFVIRVGNRRPGSSSPYNQS